MINKLNIEKIFDYLDNTSVVFYEKKKMPYLEGLNESINFLLDDEFEEEYGICPDVYDILKQEYGGE